MARDRQDLERRRDDHLYAVQRHRLERRGFGYQKDGYCPRFLFVNR